VQRIGLSAFARPPLADSVEKLVRRVAQITPPRDGAHRPVAEPAG
jgi:hypothetical protein